MGLWEYIKDVIGIEPKEISHKEHRERIEKVVKEVKPDVEITSTERSDSEAHSERGAIDISSKDSKERRHSEAKEISRALKEAYPNDTYDVVVEEVHGDTQTNTTYQGGHQGNKRENLPKEAKATHTHIEYEPPKKDEGAGG